MSGRGVRVHNGGRFSLLPHHFTPLSGIRTGGEELDGDPEEPLEHDPFDDSLVGSEVILDSPGPFLGVPAPSEACRRVAYARVVDRPSPKPDGPHSLRDTLGYPGDSFPRVSAVLDAVWPTRDFGPVVL